VITDLPFVWADSASHLITPDVSEVPAGEQDQVTDQLLPILGGLANPDQVLVVRTVDALFNGIDFLEVADGQLEDPQSALRQKVLMVHLFLPVPAAITGKETDHVSITGGSRITAIAVEWAVSADDLVNGDVSAVVPDPAGVLAELAPLLPIDDRDALQHILIVKTDQSGDFSPYELAIVEDSGDAGFTEPFFGFDLQLSRVTFSFKVDCPSDFDCLDEEVCPPAIAPAPAIDYLAKDYNSFRALMLDRMAQTIPEWKERNVADIGVAIVELLAFAGDQLSYFQDAVANEAYLGTARERASLRRHARLLDYTPREGANARTFVHLEVALVGEANGGTLPAHTPLITRTEGLAGTQVTEANLEAAILAGSHVFETMEPVTTHAAHNEIHFYTWGDDDCCLPKGAVRATLKLRKSESGSPPEASLPLILDENVDGAIKPGVLLALVEKASPNPGAPADPAHRHVVRLTEVRPSRDTLFGVDVVEIAWAREDALPFPLCLRDLEDGTPVSVAQGNIVIADHGHSVTEDLPSPTSPPGLQRFLPKLTEGPITFQAQVMDPLRNLVLFDPAAPAASALRGDVRLARPAVILFPIPEDEDPNLPPVRDCVRDLGPDSNHWLPVRDLLESGPFSQEFVVEMENDGTAQLRFGDDELGRKPTETLFACYRIGNGAGGNIGADGLVHIVAPFGGFTAVSNVVPAVGGENPEPAAEIRLNAPQAFRTQERAVTEADYAEVARRHPGIQRAVATLRFTGSWYTMFVAVDRLGGAPVDDAFKVEFANFLERFRLAGYDLEIQGAVPVPLEIKLTVCVRPGFFRFDVEEALLEAFSNRDLPDGRRGFFHPDSFTFGQPVFLSRVIAAALAVPGVATVDTGADALTFKRLRHAPTAESLEGVLKMERLEIAQLDNDPSLPENGRLEFVMQGGS
jgi:hypothetical protein